MGQAKKRKPLTVAVCIATIPPRAELLKRALASVDAQQRPADEVIVVVDEDAKGAGPTRNIAWGKATSDYVAILDDDDEFLPNHLSLLMSAAKAQRADVVYSWFEHIGWPEWREDRPDPLATVKDGKLVHPLGVPFGDEQAAHMRTHAFIPATILARRSMLEHVGGYPPPYSDEWNARGGCEDWALLIRILDAGGRIVHVPERTWKLNSGIGTAGAPWKTQLADS